MKDGDTEIGGRGNAFPVTTLGLVSRIRADRRRTIEDLAERYWRPVYHFVRVAWTKSNEDAKDLTQAFFLWLFDGQVLDRYDPARGGFRKYIKGVLRNFLGNAEQALQRLKRGGGILHVPLEDAATPDAGLDPEVAFDRAWMNEILQTAVGRLRKRIKEIRFLVFERYDLSGTKPTYADLAAELGIKDSDVRNHLFAARELLREEVRNELAGTLENPEELQEELRAFFDA